MYLRTFDNLYEQVPTFEHLSKISDDAHAKRAWDYYSSMDDYEVYVLGFNGFFDNYEDKRVEITEEEYNSAKGTELFIAYHDKDFETYTFKWDNDSKTFYVKNIVYDHGSYPEGNCIYQSFVIDYKNHEIKDTIHFPYIIPDPDNDGYTENKAKKLIERFDEAVENDDAEIITLGDFKKIKPDHYFDATFRGRSSYDNEGHEYYLFRYGTELGMAGYYGDKHNYYRVTYMPDESYDYEYKSYRATIHKIAGKSLR